MATSILTPADYAEIRAVLDVSLGGRSLPDATIGRLVYMGAGEAEAQSLMTDWSALIDAGGTSKTRVKLVAIYLTAAKLARAIPDLIREKRISGSEYAREKMNWPARALELEAKAADVLDALGITDEVIAGQVRWSAVDIVRDADTAAEYEAPPDYWP